MTTPATQPSLSRRILFIALMALLALVGLGAECLSGFLIHGMSLAIQPQRQVEHYLDAVVAGDVKQAIKLGRIDPAGGDEVLTGAVYKNVPDRVTSYTITETSVHGDEATVTADIRQGVQSYVNTFTLHPAPAVWGAIPEWQLDEQELPSIGIAVDAPSGTTATVQGVHLSVADRYVYALPGEYTVHLDGDDYFSAPDQTVGIGGFALTGPQHGERTATFDAALTEKGTVSATRAVAKYLAGCIVQDSPEPPRCPFALSTDAGASYADSVWRLDQPTVSAFSPWQGYYDVGSGDAGWQVSTIVPGTVDYDGMETLGSDRGEVYTDPFDFGLAGVITSIDAAGEATFVYTGSDFTDATDDSTTSSS